jgi:hypothetical protein
MEHMTLQPKAGGDVIKLDMFATHVFERIGNAWYLALRHAHEVPK